jgi:hypothetical protein
MRTARVSDQLPGCRVVEGGGEPQAAGQREHAKPVPLGWRPTGDSDRYQCQPKGRTRERQLEGARDVVQTRPANLQPQQHLQLRLLRATAPPAAAPHAARHEREPPARRGAGAIIGGGGAVQLALARLAGRTGAPAVKQRLQALWGEGRGGGAKGGRRDEGVLRGQGPVWS